MKVSKLILYLIFAVLILFTGCEKKEEAGFHPSSAIQVDNLEKQSEVTPAAATDAKKVTAEAAPFQKPKDKTNAKENKTQKEYKKYLGYWQLEGRDSIYNDVVRGFAVPLEIAGIDNNILTGSISFRMNDGYHTNPGCTIEIQGEIEDQKVQFNFEEVSFGSGYGIITLMDGAIEAEIKQEKPDENALFSMAGRYLYKKIPEENLRIATIPQKLFCYLDFSKEEMVSELARIIKWLI